jgi:hypothetical protein
MVGNSNIFLKNGRNIGNGKEKKSKDEVCGIVGNFKVLTGNGRNIRNKGK